MPYFLLQYNRCTTKPNLDKSVKIELKLNWRLSNNIDGYRKEYLTRVNQNDLEGSCVLRVLIGQFVQQLLHASSLSRFLVDESKDHLLVLLRVSLKKGINYFGPSET